MLRLGLGYFTPSKKQKFSPGYIEPDALFTGKVGFLKARFFGPNLCYLAPAATPALSSKT